MPRSGDRIPPGIRFWKHVSIGATQDECWNWTGATNHRGYGMFKWNPVANAISSHRASWMIFNGDIPDRLHVLHHCDNRKCVNPKHLFLGTNMDNVQDSVNKGRNTRGETHGRARLTQDQVKEIRRLYLSRMSQKNIASLFGVGRTTVGYIVRNESWRTG